MKLKLFAALGLFLVACSTQAANVSINDITLLPGDPGIVQVPILITADDPAEMVGAMNISFSAGSAGDLISIRQRQVDGDVASDEFDGSIWENYGLFFPAPNTPSVHNVLSGVTLIGAGAETAADGTLITYEIDVTGLVPGIYELNPNFADLTDARDGSLADLTLTFSSGTLTVIPEPSTVVLTGIFGVLGLGVYFKRRRG